MLRIVEPYITWGYPNLATVKKLVYKRGYSKQGYQRIALTDNKLVERRLRKLDYTSRFLDSTPLRAL